MSVAQDHLTVARQVARSQGGTDPGITSNRGRLRQEGYEAGLDHTLEYLSVHPDPAAAISELRAARAATPAVKP